MKMIILIIVLLSEMPFVHGQEEFTISCIAFYNFENLFDTIDSPDTDDFEFTPSGSNHYNSAIYYDKLSKLATVVKGIGTQFTPDGPAILGVSEIENRNVLEDFVRQPCLADRNYKIIHHDSGDGRGVDVALLYQPKYFTPTAMLPFPLVIGEKGDSIIYSRDILIVTGKLLNEPVVISVNHWPSRRGGELRTAHLRNEAAAINKRIIDSLRTHLRIEKSIIMGDLNDDPVNESVKIILNAQRSSENLQRNDMFNPFENHYRKGNGSTAYRDAWSLFDQIIIGEQFLNASNGWKYHQAEIYNPSFLTQKTGKYKGYPYRTFSNNEYIGGYSDHYPVYLLLVKRK